MFVPGFKDNCRSLRPAAEDRRGEEPVPSTAVFGLRCAALLLGLLGVALAVYLSVRPSPQIGSVSWVPHWLAQWCDRHGDIRNFPAFLMIGLPLTIALRSRHAQAWTLFLVGALALALELGQLLIPGRYASAMDVLWSWAGLVVAWGLMEAVRWKLKARTAALAVQADAPTQPSTSEVG